jgi:hypothetical protein
MRFTLPILMTLAVLGCSSGSGSPTASSPCSNAPPPTQGATAFLLAIAIAQNGGGTCIVGATVEVVAGQAVGESRTISDCSYWDPEGGALFQGLTPGVEMTLRASAAGYRPQELTVMPSPGGKATVFQPSPL